MNWKTAKLLSVATNFTDDFVKPATKIRNIKIICLVTFVPWF